MEQIIIEQSRRKSTSQFMLGFIFVIFWMEALEMMEAFLSDGKENKVEDSWSWSLNNF